MEGRAGRSITGRTEAGGPSRPEPLLHGPARRETAQGRVHDRPAGDGAARRRGHPQAGQPSQARPRVLRDGAAEDPGRARPPRPDGSRLMARVRANGNRKRLATPQSVDAAVKAICDIMRRSNCAGALQYVPELTWILFLRILDEQETREAEEAEALGLRFKASVPKPYRWRDWAAPGSPLRQDKNSSVWKFV